VGNCWGGCTDFSESKSGMRVIHRAVLGRLVGHSNLGLGMTDHRPKQSRPHQRPPTSTKHPPTTRAFFSDTTPYLPSSPLSIRQASTRNFRRCSCRPCNQVRSSARRFLRHVCWPPSLITTSTPHRNIHPISINHLRQHLLTTSKPTYRGLNVCPRRSFPDIKASIAHHGCATERRALSHRRPH